MLRPAGRTWTIDLTQKKTNREMRSFIHPDLDRIIKATPANGVYLLGDATGVSSPALTKLITRAVQDAGLPQRCKAHGLHKAILRRRAERRTGHRSLAELERYAGTAQSAGYGQAHTGTKGRHGLPTFSKFLLTSKNRQ
jgi:integrase